MLGSLAMHFRPIIQVMDGFEMVRRYRSLEVLKRIGSSTHGLINAPSSFPAQAARAPMAIVGMSANSDMTSQSLATDAGMNAFMSKPFSAADMRDIISLFD
jgi:CheY-like chemotaxis protein